MSIELEMASNHPNLCGPLFLLLSIFPSIRDCSHYVAKVLELHCVMMLKCLRVNVKVAVGYFSLALRVMSWYFHLLFTKLWAAWAEKAMAPHSSTLA